MAAGTQPTTQTNDTRRIAEDDPDYQRLHANTQRKLRASVQHLVRDLRTSPQHEHAAIQSRFIQRHVGILKDAYLRAHLEGERDYWQQVSRHPTKYLSKQHPDTARQQHVLGFYAPSVAKMAHEAQRAWQQSQAKTHPVPVKLADAPAHTGVMVAFMLTPDAAQKLALPGGEPADQLHITLAYLGDQQDLTTSQLATLKREVASFAPEAMPLLGAVSGIALFTPSASSDRTQPLVALVDVPGIQRWRAALCKRLKAAGLYVANDFEYTPHITLAYLPDGAKLPVKHLPPVRLQLDHVTLAVGEQQQTWRVGDEQYPEHWQNTEVVTLSNNYPRQHGGLFGFGPGGPAHSADGGHGGGGSGGSGGAQKKPMSGADLKNAYAGGRRDFSGENLQGASLGGGDTFEGADFSHADLSNSTFSGTTFKKCSFSEANLEHGEFHQARFLDCSFTDAAGMHADFTESSHLSSDFQNADLKAANFTHSVLVSPAGYVKASSFADANLEGAQFGGAHAARVNFSGADLTNANFADVFTGALAVQPEDAFLYQADFRHTTLDGVVMPRDPIKTRGLQFSERITLDDTPPPTDPLDAFLADTEMRVGLQANVTWPALQDGYYSGPLTDPANPFYYVYWDLEPMAKHCYTCPDYAAGSPYTPPGSGVNELDATPGDGHTECGAACKCSLRYGSGGVADQSQLMWNQAIKYWQANPDTVSSVPPALAALQQGMPAPVVLPSKDDLTVDQLIALDDFRDASIKWDLVRDDLAPLPGLFSENINWAPPSFDDLTPKQQQALVDAINALMDWGQATDVAIQEWFDNLDLREVVDPNRITLDNPYPRQHGGLFGFGPGGPRQSASGGGGGGGGSAGGSGAPHVDPARVAAAHQGLADAQAEEQRVANALAQAEAAHVSATADIFHQSNARDATERRVRREAEERYIATHPNDVHPQDVADYHQTRDEWDAAEQHEADVAHEHAAGRATAQQVSQASAATYRAEVAHRAAATTAFGHQAEAQIDQEVSNHPDLVVANDRVTQAYNHADATEAARATARQDMENAIRGTLGAQAELHVVQGNTNAIITYVPDLMGGGQGAVHHVFGRDLSDEELMKLTGAKAGDQIEVTRAPYSTGFQVKAQGPDVQRRYIVERNPHTGEVVLEDKFTRNLGPRNPQAALLQAEGIQGARDLGIDRIHASADRSPDTNGYDTWPKWGFDGRIPDRANFGASHTVLQLAHMEFGNHVTMVSDILGQAGGRAWWKANGGTFDAELNFHNPVQMAKFEARRDRYRARAQRSGGGASTPTPGGQP